jgi:phosphatidylinositol alpha-mannosyltransferase
MEGRLRVVLACPYAWDVPGGVQVHVRGLAAELRRRGHRILVLAPAGGPRPGVTVVGRPVRFRYQGTVAPICFWPWSIPRIRAALRGFGPDVVHAHEPLTPSTAMFATLQSPVPVVATFHAFAERSALYTAARPVLRPVWRRLAVRVAVSEAAAAFVRSRFEGALRVVPNGCDVDGFAAGRPAQGLPAGRRLLWVGRLDPQKGFRVALAAFRALAKELDDLSLIVAGDGPDRGAVHTLPPDVRRRVVLLGAVPNEQLPSCLAAADVFFSPATGQESFGMTLVEAMAAGVPVVASDIDGYREVVRDGGEGLLVRPNDPAALAGAVRRVLGDPALASALVEEGRRRAQGYRWEVVAADIEAAYRDALAGGRQ